LRQLAAAAATTASASACREHRGCADDEERDKTTHDRGFHLDVQCEPAAAVQFSVGRVHDSVRLRRELNLYAPSKVTAIPLLRDSLTEIARFAA